MKKIFITFCLVFSLFFNYALAAEDVPRDDINNDPGFNAGQIHDWTTAGYQTSNFVVEVRDSSGNVLASGNWFEQYNTNGTSSDGYWAFEGTTSVDSVLDSMGLSDSEKQEVKEALRDGGEITFDPRFDTFATLDSGVWGIQTDKPVVKTTTSGKQKTFYMVATGLTPEQIANNGWNWGELTKSSFDKQHYVLKIEPSPLPTPDPTPDPSPDPEDPTPTHEHSWEDDSRDCDPHGGYGGNPATTSDFPFSSMMDGYKDNTEGDRYRKAHPYFLGDDFTLSGCGHIEGYVYTPSTPVYWACGGYSQERCTGCGLTRNYDPCGANGIYLQFWPALAEYTDTYHNVSMSFTGFRVDGKSEVEFEPSSKFNVGSPPYRDSNFSENYIITDIIEEKLKSDSSSGLLYGTATVACACGCPSDTYNVYFDLISPPIITSTPYDLIVRAEPQEGGKVRIGAGEYLTSDTKEFCFDSPYTVEAKADDGYKFDGWYDTNGKKSDNPQYSGDMPGYNLTLVAKFIQQDIIEDEYCNITVYTKGSGCVRFEDSEEVNYSLSTDVLKGCDKTILALPNEGSTFLGWERLKKFYIGDGYSYTLERVSTDKSLALNDIKEDYIIIAYFMSPYSYELSAMSYGNGTVAIDKGEYSGYQSVITDDKTPHILDADADYGFVFSHWTDIYGKKVSDDDEWKDVIVEEDMLYIAHFVPENLYIHLESAGGGTVSEDIDNAVYGESYYIGAYPDEKHEFLEWRDKKTGKKVDYPREGEIEMPAKNLDLRAYFGEVKYNLTVESTEGGSATGSGTYPPGDPVRIKVTNIEPGYGFVGWYVDNQLEWRESSKSIPMPYYDLTVKAVFRKISYEYVQTPFKILSIRDIRWQDYFAGGGNVSSNYLYIPRYSGENDVLVNVADLIDSKFDKYRNINYGYAIEFELVTSGIEKSKSTLVVTPTIYKAGTSQTINVDLGDYSIIKSSSNKSREMFMITSKEKITKISDSPEINNPIVTWNWVYYLPLDIYEDIYDESDGNNVVIKFDIKVKTTGGAEFDYVKVINYMNNNNSSYENRSAWGGNVFTYNMKETLLDDIYDDAIN